MIGEFVLLRTQSAGVHYGTLRRFEITGGLAICEITDARRLWSWQGAMTLHEISLHGVQSGSKASKTVDRIAVIGVIEVLFPTAKGRALLEAAKWDA